MARTPPFSLRAASAVLLALTPFTTAPVSPFLSLSLSLSLYMRACVRVRASLRLACVCRVSVILLYECNIFIFIIVVVVHIVLLNKEENKFKRRTTMYDENFNKKLVVLLFLL